MGQDERAEDIKRAIACIEAELSAIKQFVAHYDEGDSIAMMAQRTPDLKAAAMCLDYQCRRYVEIDRAVDKDHD